MAIFLRPVFARKLFDIDWASIIHGILAGLLPPYSSTHEADDAVITHLEQLWAPSQTLVAFSVRSALDLLLQACAFPPGSEIIISAITIPDMPAIIRLHDLVPVAVDVQYEDASVSVADVAALISPRTKAVLVAHLFGGRHSLAQLAELTRSRNLLLIEDCAQAFCGGGYLGSPEAAVSMFSFGPIKTCTALGGALVTVRKPKLQGTMKAIQATYYRQKRAKFLKRMIKYAAFKALTQNPYAYGILIAALRAFKEDHHDAITKLSHSLAANADILSQIRLRPSIPLVMLLTRRISHFDPISLDRRSRRVADIANRLPSSLQPIGYKPSWPEGSRSHHYWICPIRVSRPRVVLDELLAAGFDAASGDASLAVVAGGSVTGEMAQVEETGQPCVKAREMLADVIYLPVDNLFSQEEVQRLVNVIVTCTKEDQ